MLNVSTHIPSHPFVPASSLLVSFSPAHDQQFRERAGRPGAVELRRSRGGCDRRSLGRSLVRECRMWSRPAWLVHSEAPGCVLVGLRSVLISGRGDCTEYWRTTPFFFARYWAHVERVELSPHLDPRKSAGRLSVLSSRLGGMSPSFHFHAAREMNLERRVFVPFVGIVMKHATAVSRRLPCDR